MRPETHARASCYWYVDGAIASVVCSFCARPVYIGADSTVVAQHSVARTTAMLLSEWRRSARSGPSNGGRTWWAHFELTRINIEPIILRKKIEELRVLGAFRVGPRGCILWKSPGVSHVRFILGDEPRKDSCRSTQLQPGRGPLSMSMLIALPATVTG